MMIKLYAHKNSYDEEYGGIINTDFIAYVGWDARMSTYTIELTSGTKHQLRKAELSPQFMKWLSDANHS